MDRVRFGRALGSGAREFARALARAAQAALAPDPRDVRRAAKNSERSSPPTRAEAVPRRRLKNLRTGLQRGSRSFGDSAFKPFAKASSVLWFEFTGSFFGLFALALAIETWKHRGELRPGVIFTGHAWLAPAMMLVFLYFTISSFVRASRRSRC